MGSPHKARVRHRWANPLQTHIWAADMSDKHGQITYEWVAHIKPLLDTHGQNGHIGSPPKAYVEPIKNRPQDVHAHLCQACLCKAHLDPAKCWLGSVFISLIRRLSSLVMAWHLWRAAVVISDDYSRSMKISSSPSSWRVCRRCYRRCIDVLISNCEYHGVQFLQEAGWFEE